MIIKNVDQIVAKNPQKIYEMQKKYIISEVWTLSTNLKYDQKFLKKSTKKLRKQIYNFRNFKHFLLKIQPIKKESFLCTTKKIKKCEKKKYKKNFVY